VMVRGEKNRSYLASRLTGHSGLEGGQSGRRFMVPPSNKNLRREKNKNKKDHPNSQTCADFFDKTGGVCSPTAHFLSNLCRLIASYKNHAMQYIVIELAYFAVFCTGRFLFAIAAD